MKPKIIAYTELAFLALALALFLWWVSPNSKRADNESEPQFATTSHAAYFPSVEIEAKSAYVYDSHTGKVLYEKDAELQLPLASLTKLMSALTASTLIPKYMLVKITSEDLREEGDSGLYTDEEWNVEKLIDYSLVVSSNDGIRAIASVGGSQIANESSSSPEIKFVNEMNRMARELGLSETYFLNQSGLDVTETLSGGYGSARDTAILVDHILKENPHLLEATTFDKITISSKDKIHQAINTNKAIPSIPNILGSKTGFTDLSGGNVVVAWNAGIDRPIIIAVLGSSYDGRFTDLSKLVDATLSYFSNASTTISIPKRI